MRSLCWRHSCKYQGTRATDKEPFPVQFGDVITSSPAAQKSSCLFLLLSGIITSCFVHSSPCEVFCCLASLLAIKHVPFGLFSRWLSSWMQHPKVHPPSQIESHVFFFCLVFLHRTISSSSTLLDLAGSPDFTPRLSASKKQPWS